MLALMVVGEGFRRFRFSREDTAWAKRVMLDL